MNISVNYSGNMKGKKKTDNKIWFLIKFYLILREVGNMLEL
jgi:hypothetical protein